jgi:hypothetical protein
MTDKQFMDTLYSNVIQNKINKIYLGFINQQLITIIVSYSSY